MVRRWLFWLLALLGALVLRVAYTGWLAGYVLAGIGSLPLLGLAVSVPALLSARVELKPEKPRVERMGTAHWQVTIHNGLGLPLARVRAAVRSENKSCGLQYLEKGSWFVPGVGTDVTLPAPTEHCGLLEGKLVQVWALDALGLFWLPIRRRGIARLWVEPIPQSVQAFLLPQEEASGSRPRPGGGPGEDYDPRAYRPGDPLNVIHWKLSAKRDELVTRETLESVQPLPLLTLDWVGGPETLDAVLDLLTGVSQALLEKGRAHTVAWAEPVTGELCRCTVTGREELIRCLEALLSLRAPLTGKSVLDMAGMEKRAFHLRPGGGEE